MVPIDASASRFCRSRRVQIFALIAVLGTSAARTAAAERVSISHGEPALKPLADRLASELASDGYSVAFGPGDEPSPCEQPAIGDAASNADAVWVRLASDPGAGDSVVASICFRSSVALLQRVTARAPRSEPERFALTTAEALNGLRAQVPVVSSRATNEDRARPSPPDKSFANAASMPIENSVALSQAAQIDLGGFPVLWGAELDAELAMTPVLRLVFASFVPISAAELANEQVRTQTRFAWVRAGVAARLTQGVARFGCSLLAGPALTWATAEAQSPYVGAADVALSALLTLAATVEYPSDSRVFVLGATRLSSLLPAVRVAVGGETSPALGPWLLETSLGVGLRFGGR